MKNSTGITSTLPLTCRRAHRRVTISNYCGSSLPCASNASGTDASKGGWRHRRQRRRTAVKTQEEHDQAHERRRHGGNSTSLRHCRQDSNWKTCNCNGLHTSCSPHVASTGQDGRQVPPTSAHHQVWFLPSRDRPRDARHHILEGSLLNGLTCADAADAAGAGLLLAAVYQCRV